MTIITVPFKSSSHRRSGFTLAELLVATTLSSLVFAALFSAFIFMGRSTLGISNYSSMNTESRFGLEIFGRDMRSAENIAEGFSSTGFTIVVPNAGEVTYRYDADHPDRPLFRRDDEGEQAIMTGVEELNFRYFDLQAEAATVPIQVKQIQLQLKLVREAINIENTEKVVSARYIMRNKKVSN